MLRWSAVALLVLLPGVLQAAPSDFPRPSGLEPQVAFWRAIFSQYSQYQIVFHDAEYPSKIIRVLDFRPMVARGEPAAVIERTMARAERNEEIAIDHVLTRLHAAGNNPQNLKADDSRIHQLYADVKSPRKFLNARGRIRAQRGLREKFREALIVSGRYLPAMEGIFTRAGLPIELTRLPFVESSFNLKAYSKVGAAGIWQFMPASARLYMRLNDVVDDRRDPLFSTEAAAAHLRDDYNALQSWPLAVTAYNHGRYGVVRAMKRLGTRNIAEIARRYRSPSFGFASRNFYASFLAAVDVYRDYQKYFGVLTREPPMKYEYVRIHDYVQFATLGRLSGMNTETFRSWNPAYNDEVVAGRLWVPPLHRIRVPAGTARVFALRYSGLTVAERKPTQRRYYAEHKVKPGQSLGVIAQQYGTSVKAIQQANNMGKGARIRAGQALRVPAGTKAAPAPGAAATQVAKAEAAVPAPGSVPRGPAPAESKQIAEPQKPSTSVETGGTQRKPLRHKVVAGQTVGHIAQRYNTSVRAIMHANKISDPKRVRVGTVLVIPSS